MTKGLKAGTFKIWTFLIVLVIITSLTVLSFLAAWAKDEGQINEQDGIIKNLLADCFYFFRLPTHGLFKQWIFANASTWFLPTLAFNIIFWTVLIERLVSFGRIVKQKKKI